VVFTLPSELRAIVAMNRERLFGMMFEAASQTLLLLSRDKKRLGGMPAITMVLHTWTRELTFHPHVHAIVSAGALSKEGEWLKSRADYLFEVIVPPGQRESARGRRCATTIRRAAPSSTASRVSARDAGA
jgi:hypothetical protein